MQVEGSTLVPRLLHIQVLVLITIACYMLVLSMCYTSLKM